MNPQDDHSHFAGQLSESEVLDLQPGAPRAWPAVMRPKVLSNARLERILICISLMLGFVHFWMGRYAMNADGMSYLDVGDAFFHHDWAGAFNGWWSPLYPWLIGTVLGIAKPSASSEFPLVQLVNFVVFVLALLAFRYLLHSLLDFVRERTSDRLPDWALTLLSYAVFLWIALEVETLYDVSPDMGVMACFCLSIGVLLRLHSKPTSSGFALLGLILATGYWAKTFLFPMGFAILIAGYLWKRSTPGWGRGIFLATVVFLCGAAPLIFYLSSAKGRLTFGDSGSVNFAWAMAPSTARRNYQGEVPGTTRPLHPTRQLLAHPPLFEFDGPVRGTYPPWTDPSYWNDGVRARFSIRGELAVLSVAVPSEIRLVFRDRPDVVAGVIILALFSGFFWVTALVDFWPVIVLPIVGMFAYAIVIENDRYLGGFVLVLFLAAFAAVRIRPELQKSAQIVAVAVFITMMSATADYTVRILTHHMAIPGVGPNSTLMDITTAQQLALMSVTPGMKVGIIGDGTGAYWARLAKVKIVAEIMGMGHGPREFWNSSADVQQQVYRLFRQAHAEIIVTECPAGTQAIPDGWTLLPGTSYCVKRLDSDVRTNEARTNSR